MSNRDLDVITLAQTPAATLFASAVILGNLLAFDPAGELSLKLLEQLWSLVSTFVYLFVCKDLKSV